MDDFLQEGRVVAAKRGMSKEWMWQKCGIENLISLGQ